MRLLVLLISLLLFAGCVSLPTGETYLDETPVFNLEQFFDGKVKTYGIVQGRDGEVFQRFTVDIIGTLNGDTLSLDETFTYGMGNGPTKRLWNITKQSDGTYNGTANDVATIAKGEIFGNAFYFGYEMDLPVDNTSYRVKFDDWMWAFDDSTLVNRSYIRKFGITFAEVTIFMIKEPVL
jgi:hypothetical protein